jgi:predicted PurR-regulated permease PerM
MSEKLSPPTSPRWGATTKLVVGLTLIAAISALVIQFRTIIGPLLLALILSYLLHPVAEFGRRVTHLSWRASVNIIFLIVILLFLGSITATGVTVFQQVQSLINFIGSEVTDLPSLVEDISHWKFQLGPFELSLEQYDLGALANQLLSAIQPVLGRVGGVFGSLATGAAAVVGWGFFIILIAYFILGDANQIQIRLDLPGYEQDLGRLRDELRKVWNSYLRGQLILFTLVAFSYSILMGILGVRFAIGIAVLSGLARFVPYVGTWSVAIVTFLAAFFQTTNYFNLVAWQYALLVLAAAFVLDFFFDNVISPRLMGDTLGVHPAAVLIAAIVAANLIGIIGLLLAAPVLATLQLALRYVTRKLFDLDPWPAGDLNAMARSEPVTERLSRFLQLMGRWWRRILPKKA